jgi:hypothetical protein
VASSDGLDVADGRQIGAAPLSWRRALSRATTCVAVDDHDRIVVGTRDAAWLSSDGQTFAAIPPRAVERGDWGSLEIEARGFVRMRVAPGGAVWAIAGSGPCHVVRLADERPRWIPVCAGLTFIPGVGSRRAQVTTTAIHFTPDGTAFAVTASQGLFRRAPEAGASV